jgi:hypothetical protein
MRFFRRQPWRTWLYKQRPQGLFNAGDTPHTDAHSDVHTDVHDDHTDVHTDHTDIHTDVHTDIHVDIPVPDYQPFRFVLEMELNGFLNGWTEIVDFLKHIPVVGDRGLPDGSPRALVAKTGTMLFGLNNAENNSYGRLGAFSPGHANCVPGFVKGIGVRFSIVIDGDVIPQFTGRLENIRPTSGERGARVTYCTVVDFMNETAKKRLSTLSMQTDILDHEAFALVTETIPLQPRALEIGTGFDTLQYVFDTVQDERTSPMTEYQRINQSTLAKTYVKKDGTLTYEPRSIRALNITTPTITLGPDDFRTSQEAVTVDDDRATVINRVTGQLHPRTPSTEPDRVLYSSESIFHVPPQIDISIRGYYSQDTLRARRAGGLDMLPAVAVTDYVFNTLPDGSGTDVTADVTVDTVYTANSVLFTINAPVACYCLKLQSRGTQVVDNADMAVFAEDVDSINQFGEVAFSLDMPYVADPAFGNEVVQYILFLAQANVKRVQNVRVLVPNDDLERAKLLCRREISDRIGIVEPMNALSSAFFINSIRFELDANDQFWLTWVPALADSTQYWYLEIPGYTELNFTTRLGFGLIIGHTDVDHADDHADVIHSDVAHSDTHGDVAHADAAHADAAHTDTSHTNTAHSDVPHGDGHGDSGHGDNAHDDSHSDVAHNDGHSDVAHADQAHGDVSFQGYTDTHDDTHADFHSDEFNILCVPDGHCDSHSDSHTNSHIDDGGHPHTDIPHYDGAHTDAHTNSSHSDSHGDVGHGDAAHSDSHGDGAHSDILHGDMHGDTGHGDAGHADSVHTDNHSDVSHADTAHADTHADTAHGDHN